jgi:selenide,water dikinase
LQPFSASIHAVTDVTGFGLLGHAFEMATGSGVSLRLDSSQMEWIDGALDCARAGHLAGGLKNNREFVGDCAAFEASVPSEVQHLLYDPQTSGGLLVAIAPDQVEAAQRALRAAGCPAMLVGEVLPKTSPLIAIR